jgi:hypothetical protein
MCARASAVVGFRLGDSAQTSATKSPGDNAGVHSMRSQLMHACAAHRAACITQFSCTVEYAPILMLLRSPRTTAPCMIDTCTAMQRDGTHWSPCGSAYVRPLSPGQAPLGHVSKHSSYSDIRSHPVEDVDVSCYHCAGCYINIRCYRRVPGPQREYVSLSTVLVMPL